jgi:hypothetical protein
LDLTPATPNLSPVFSADKDCHCNACLNWTHDPLELYTVGYKLAADSLVDKVDETGEDQDSLVYPVCFLYRQYIELRLKEIIRSGRKLIDEPGDFPQHHKIQDLWNTAVPILKKAFAHESSPLDLSRSDHVVSEFAKVDPESFAFRYPTDKTGASQLQGMWHINLRRLRDFVNAFADDLDSASAGISVYLDYKHIMES